MVVRIIRASKRNFAMLNKTTLGPGDQLAIDIILRVYERGIQAVHRFGAWNLRKAP
jgi:hypothetical protein